MLGPTFEYGRSLLCLCGCGEIRRPNVARSYTHFAPEAYLPGHFRHIASNSRSFQGRWTTLFFFSLQIATSAVPPLPLPLRPGVPAARWNENREVLISL